LICARAGAISVSSHCRLLKVSAGYISAAKARLKSLSREKVIGGPGAPPLFCIHDYRIPGDNPLTFKNLMKGIFFGGVTAVLFIVLTGLFQPGLNANTEINVTSGEVAIHGYDTVAYFTEKKAVKGTAEIMHRWKGATWQFASAANRDMFAANPGKYAPQYGGY
jgi:YHS domain-containing protein